MPCNIGFKSVIPVKIPKPLPKKFRKKVEAPKIDSDLLAKIGEDDPEFLEWLQELDINPLLAEALKRALAKAGSLEKLKFFLPGDGTLEAKAEYENEREKEELEKTAADFTSLWQMEILAIVAQLLDYEVAFSRIKVKGREVMTIEAEKQEGANVHKYLKIIKDADNAAIAFEHFDSKESLAKERAKFLGLAQKLGVRIEMGEIEESGQAIATGTVHKNFLKQ